MSRASACAGRAPVAPAAGTMPRCTSETRAGVRRESGEGACWLPRRTRRPRRSSHAGHRAAGRARDWLVPISAQPRQGTSVSMRPAADGRGQRHVAGGDRGHQVHRLEHRHGLRVAEQRHDRRPPRAPAALTVARAAIVKVRPLSASRTSMPVTRLPLANGGDRLDVVREVGAAPVRGLGERERQPLGFDHLVVVPLRAAGQPVRRDAGKEARASPPSRRRRGSGRCSSGSSPSLRSAAEPAVDRERRRASASRLRGHERYVPTRKGSGRSSHGAMRARARRSRMDSQRAIEPADLQRAQAAVRGFLMVERGRRRRSRPLRPARSAARGCWLRRRWPVRRCRRRSTSRSYGAGGEAR